MRDLSAHLSGRTLRIGSAILQVALVIACVATTAGAQNATWKPEAWFLSVSHRVDVGAQVGVSNKEGRASTPRPRTLNLTSGILIDSEGHVVTRLVNLDPTARQQDIKITTSTGKILESRFLGVDGPTGITLLVVPELRGVAPVPVPSAPVVADEQAVRVISPYYTIRTVTAIAERVALFPELRLVDAALDGPQQASFTRRTAVIAGIASRSLSTADDLGVVETSDGKPVGLVRYRSPGRGDLLSLSVIRDVIAPRIIAANGNVQAGWFGAVGMSVRDVPEPRRGGLGVADGVLIEMISSGGPADTAGLLINDIVTAFDDVPVASTIDLATLVAASPAGSRVVLKTFRGGQEQPIPLVLGGKPLSIGSMPVAMVSELRSAELRLGQLKTLLTRSRDQAERARLQKEITQVENEIDLIRSTTRPVEPRAGSASVDGLAKYGLTVRTASPQVAEAYGVKSGLFIDEVAPGGLAMSSGLRATDLIVQVGTIKVADPPSLAAALQSAALSGQASVIVSVVRNKTPTAVTLELEPRKKTP